jgi:hypothetical protein
VVYAPGFALGVRANWGSILFAEMDLTYQFAKAIDQTSPYQHAILGRAALGAQLSRKVALIIGGGPRVNLVEDPGKLNGLAVSFAPHAYAGLQLF